MSDLIVKPFNELEDRVNNIQREVALLEEDFYHKALKGIEGYEEAYFNLMGQCSSIRSILIGIQDDITTIAENQEVNKND